LDPSDYPIASYYCEGAANALSRHDATFVDDVAADFLGGFFIERPL
jgi:hypothetical protein